MNHPGILAMELLTRYCVDEELEFRPFRTDAKYGDLRFHPIYHNSHDER